MLRTPTFLAAAMNQGLSPASHVQLMSGCAGAGRQQSQAASPSWPVEIFHTRDITLSFTNWNWPGGRNSVFSVSLNCTVSSVLFPWVPWVLWNSWVWQNPRAPGNLWLLRPLLCDRLHNWLSGREKNYIVYSLICIFFISSSINISFLVLLNGFISTHDLIFVHSPPHPTVVGRSKWEVAWS